MKGYETKLRAVEKAAKQQKIPMCIMIKRDGTQEAYYGNTCIPPACTHEYAKAITDDENIGCLLSALGGEGLMVELKDSKALLKPFRQVLKEMKQNGAECV